jgi:hypothetical protein
VLTCRTCGTVRIERFCKGINICIAALSRICIASPYNPRAMCVLPLPLGDASDGRSTAHSRPKGDARPSVPEAGARRPAGPRNPGKLELWRRVSIAATTGKLYHCRRYTGIRDKRALAAATTAQGKAHRHTAARRMPCEQNLFLIVDKDASHHDHLPSLPLRSDSKTDVPDSPASRTHRRLQGKYCHGGAGSGGWRFLGWQQHAR